MVRNQLHSLREPFGWSPLAVHPHHPPHAVYSILAKYDEEDEDGWALQFRVIGQLDRIRRLDPLADPDIAPQGAIGLWQSTCFEIFIAEPSDAGYSELNFVPDGQWACYHFDDYRVMHAADVCPPEAMQSYVRDGEYHFLIDPGWTLCPGNRIGLSAVIEETDGTKSYWALAHPRQGPPDFHHPDCFALTLPAPEQP